MKIFGADLPREGTAAAPAENTLVLLDDSGSIHTARHPSSIPELAAAIGELADGAPFLVAVNLPIVVPTKASRARPVENLIRRRFGHRLRPGGRAALSSEPGGVAGEALLAGLAAAGHPCLPYPDRDRRSSSVAEIHSALTLKALLWEASAISRSSAVEQRERLFRAFAAPAYRASDSPKRSSWADRAVALDLVLRALATSRGYDLGPAREALLRADSEQEVERAGALLDASLLAGTALRYLDAPEDSLFIGDREEGYVIMPADGFVRRLALRDARPRRGQLFPRASLRERLGSDAVLRPADLLSVEGRGQRLEASFENEPVYEFDNLDEMLWWKHCRHLVGPTLPTEGLRELLVVLGKGEINDAQRRSPLRLSRSRHQTLSFRFDPPEQWRTNLPTRDGKTYPFRVLRAIYDTEE